VVYHHDANLNPGVHAAAVQASQVSGKKGHVVLGQPFTAGYKPPKGQDPKYRRGVVNHELAHASVKQPPRQNGTVLRNIGEEARADAVSGADAYLKNKAVLGSKTSKILNFVGRKKPEVHEAMPQLAAGEKYHKIRNIVRVVSRGK
jgi:Rieske Fe-S protein